MTTWRPFTPAELARMDQLNAGHHELIDELIETARLAVAARGREYTVTLIAQALTRTRLPRYVATMAAVAVLRLYDVKTAEGPREPGPRRPRHDLLNGAGGSDSIPMPNACMACGIDRHGHFSRWHRIAERHTWIEPSNELRLARMRARREARQIARMRARKANPQSTSEDQCPTS